MADGNLSSTARILDVTPEEYHLDPCETPSLSASCGTTLITKSPYHAWLGHPRLGGMRRAATDAMDEGSVKHALVFGVGAKIAVITADDFKTKAAREARDSARAKGLIPILERHYDDAVAVAKDIKLALDEAGIALTGQSECVITWTEESALGPVQCRAMMDHVDVRTGEILDLKNTRSAHPRDCARSVIEYGYDVQHAAYTSALRKLRPELAGRERFTFLFVEELPEGSPRRALLTVARFDGMFRELGRRRWERAVDTWAACLKDDQWPSYAPLDTAVELEAPTWALAQEGV